MDRRLLFALPGLLILIVVGVAAWFVTARPQATAPATITPATASSTDLSGQAIYTNGAYGFFLVYPQNAVVEDSFKTYYHLPSAWRANALPNASGTPIVAVVAYRTESDHSYPRYFTAEVRVGVSADSREVSACEKAGENETFLPDTKIGSATFKTFSFSQAGMMQYLKGISYRAVHDGKCYAIEKLAAGSSYRDDAPTSADVSDATLDSKYARLDEIGQSFSFAR